MSDVQSSLNQMARGAGILLIGSVLAKVINYVYRSYLARNLSVSEYGLLELCIMIITISAALATLGMEPGLYRYVPYYKGLENKKKIEGAIYFSAKVTLIASIIISVIIYLSSNNIAKLFENSAQMAILLKIFSISIPFLAVGNRIFLTCLLLFKNIKEYSFIFNIMQHLSRVLFTIILIIAGFGLFGVSVAYSLNAIVIGMVAFYVFNSKNKIKKEEYEDKKEFLKYSIPLFLVTIISYINGWVDAFMVGYLLDNYNVGLYSAAFQLSQLLYLFPSMVLPLTMPIIGPHFARKEYVSVDTIAKQVTKWIFAVNFFILLILLAYPGIIIRIIFGTKYFESVTVLIILSVSFFI